jgi:hypothetical protein
MSAGASARVRATDVVITNMLDPGNLDPVSVALSFSLVGMFSLSQNPLDDTRASAAVSIDYGLGVPGPGSTAIPDTIGAINRLSDAGVFAASNSGIFFGVIGDEMMISGVFQTPTFVVPVGTPLVLTLGLISSANTVTRDGGIISASSQFPDTLAFATGAVFVLPTGYTANSVQAGIVDNVAAIPEPEIYAMMLAGIGLVSFAARRTRRKLS